MKHKYLFYFEKENETQDGLKAVLQDIILFERKRDFFAKYPKETLKKYFCKKLW